MLADCLFCPCTCLALVQVCNHPYLFLKEYVLDDEIVRSSGKFLLLERMLFKLKAAGHRVLIFSQMVETLKLLEDYLRLRGAVWLPCLIDHCMG